MNFSRPFILRPIATSLLMVALLVAGMLAWRLLPVAAPWLMGVLEICTATRRPSGRSRWHSVRTASPRFWRCSRLMTSGRSVSGTSSSRARPFICSGVVPSMLASRGLARLMRPTRSRIQMPSAAVSISRR